MATLYVSEDYPDGLDAHATVIKHLLTVYGPTLTSIAAAVLHEAAFHGLRSKVETFGASRVQPSGTYVGNVHFQDPSSLGATTLYVPWRSSAIATHVAVDVLYQAAAYKGTPVIDLSLTTQAGSQLDPPSGSSPGIRLNEANGELDVTNNANTRGFSASSEQPVYPEARIVCAEVLADVASYPTFARALSYGTAAGTATDVRLVITATNARILQVTVLELPPGTVTV